MQSKTKKLLAALIAAGIVPAAHAADIKLGVAEALSGGAAQYGVSIRNGFQLAADEINAAGGINGNKIVLVVEDEQGKKEEAINVFKKLIFKDNVLMVFGPTLSNSAQAADPIAQAAKTVAFGTSNTADGITSIGNYVFRNSVTEADVLPATISTVKAKTGLKNVAVLYGNDDVFTKSGYDNFKKALEDQKIPVTTTETFAKGDVDFKAQLTKIKGTNPDAIVLSALLAEGAPIMVQARQLGINVPVIGGNGMNSVKIFDLAPGGASNNLWIGSPWSIENKAPENVKFIDAYKAKFNGSPDQFAAHLDQAVSKAQACQRVGDRIGGIALGDARQVERDAARLPQRRPFGIPAQVPPATHGPGLLDRRRIGRGLRPLRPMAPEIDQMPDRRIERAVAQRCDAQGRVDHRCEIGRQRAPAARCRTIESHQLRVGRPVAHLRDQIVQSRLHRHTHALRAGHVAGGVEHPPHRPHRLAAQCHDRRRIAVRHGIRVDPGRQDDPHGVMTSNVVV